MWVAVDPIPLDTPVYLSVQPGDGVAWVESGGGGDWLNVGPFRGPAGINGATGPTGPMGTQGIQGIRGATGVTGAQGVTGPAGNNASNYVLSVNSQTGAVTLKAENIALDASISVIAVSQGGYLPGAEIPAGTALSAIIKKMLQVRVPATYTQPTLTISTSSAVEYEYGATPTIALALAWDKKDAGDATQFTYQTTSGAVLTTLNAATPTNYSHTFSSRLTAVTTFNGTVAYTAGAQKPDNMGDLIDPAIVAGTKTASNTVTITPRYRRYWGLSVSASLTDAEILQLNSELAVNRFQTRNDFFSTGQYIYIVYPAAFDLAIIKFNGYIATSSWERTLRDVVNANTISAPYYIYRTKYTQYSPDIDIEVL